jgi:fluoride ion exporter CrcB/FEX
MTSIPPDPTQAAAQRNGPVAAALFSAGLGCFLIGLLNVLAAASKPLSKAFSIYAPSGALSGETTLAVVVWLAAWYLLAKRWRTSTQPFTNTLRAADLLLFAGLLMTFPPIVHTLAAL